MRISKLDHISISTSCLEETRQFYCELLGLEVGFRPQLKSTGYWLYSGNDALVHLVEIVSGEPDGGKEAPKDRQKARPGDMIETGMDDHIAMSVEDSAGLVRYMKDRDMAYWDRLLADRGLYQVFIRDPNGMVIELNDYAPELDKIDPMTVQGKN